MYIGGNEVLGKRKSRGNDETLLCERFPTGTANWIVGKRDKAH